ncbi:MAG: hypothetical protein NZ958_00260 [Bacteroidia bacterium]|nr:hypothetical protein [Bacteroidia bacterium]MDW8088177.1 hypothetical protein [Bacteroidia bacterium]
MALRRLLYHGALYGFTAALSRFLNWALTPLYAHRLSIEDFGRLSELYSWMVFGLIAAGAGMETAYFRFRQREGDFWRFLGLTMSVGMGLAGLCALLVPWVAGPLGYAHQPELLWLTIAIWTVDAWGNFALAHLRAIGRPLAYMTIHLTHIGLFLALNIYGVGLKGYGLTFILSANLFTSSLRWVLGLWLAPPFAALRAGAWQEVGVPLRYGLLLAGMGLIGATNDVLDRILLARHNLHETALYSAAYKVAMALALFVQAYRQAGEPLLLGTHRAEIPFYRRSWLLYHAVSLGGVFLLSLWAEPLVSTTWGGILPAPLFPAAYHEALAVVPILLWANLLMGSLIQASIWYKLSTLPTTGVWITALGSLITWVGNLYGIPRWGYPACAWTTLLAYASMVGLSLSLGWRKWAQAFPLFPLVPLVGLALLALLGNGLSLGPKVLLSLVGLTGFALYGYLYLRGSAILPSA